MIPGARKIVPWVPPSWTEPMIDRSSTTYLFVKGMGRKRPCAINNTNLAYYNGFDPNHFEYYVDELRLKPDDATLWKQAICLLLGHDKGGKFQTTIQQSKALEKFHKLFNGYREPMDYDRRIMTPKKLKEN